MSQLTLKEKAYQEIRRLIITGEIKPGEFLSERSLVERLEMSRTPIRSALDRLEIEGFIKQSPKQGVVVEEISINRAFDIYELRMAIESYVVNKLSLRTIQDSEIKRLQENLNQQKLLIDTEMYDNASFLAFLSLDLEFHNELIKIVENKEFIQIMDQIQDKLLLIASNVFRKQENRMMVSYEDHMRIFNYILNGQNKEAVDEMIKHLEYGKQILIS
ncbi:GntR family transcriptional regulator [Bacillus sp. es.034]|uniref:GntR family transcriptional regulator n=1 Tax=Bacillus sp. es.034 TaxID=1761763 RepID=UPI000BF61F20|nr:GntR family transcriptional regulator [Bacillus sp. es.034]PFG03357.1 DNA-binding GntR family transcriptional regulator [Bacillus sp. es.034]